MGRAGTLQRTGGGQAMKKAKAKGKAKAGRKRSTVKDLGAKKAGSVKGGLLPATQSTTSKKISTGLLLPAVQKVADGSV
jgi:hypothetical protein